MNNLKRVLSLALSGIMLVGMMAMGASAADFTDADEITHRDAVDILVALDVINGQDDGSFNPKGDVTRAQMAKMIAVAMKGGNDVSTGVKSTASFTDIKGHWAESYIEYCYDLGIINGRGEGVFAPDDKVTGVEAAKMVLTALGYDSEAYKLTGAQWSTRTDELARTAKPSLYEALGNDVVLNAPANRDTAAQMIWNGLQNATMKYEPSTNTNSGEVTWNYKAGATMLKVRYNADIYTGTFDANSNTNTSLEKGHINVTRSEELGVGATTTINTAANSRGNASFPADIDVDFLGEEVQVIYKNGTRSTQSGPDKNDTIYGVFVTGTTNVVRTTRDKLEGVKNTKRSIKVDGVEYEIATSTTNNVTTNAFQVYNNYVEDTTAEGLNILNSTGAVSTFASTEAYASGDAVKIILDGTGKIDTFYFTNSKLAMVTGVTSDKVTINNGVGTIKKADNDIYDDVAKDDVVTVTTLYDSKATNDGAFSIVKKAEVVSGSLSAYKITDGDYKSVTVDGTTYKVHHSSSSNVTGLTDIGISKAILTLDADALNVEADAYLVNGFVAAVKKTSAAANNYSVVMEIRQASAASSAFSSFQLYVMNAEGTKSIIDVNKKVVLKGQGANGADKTIDLTNTNDVASAQAAFHVGDIITYTLDKNNKADVTVEGVPATAKGYNKDTKEIAGVVTNADAVVFVMTEGTITVGNTGVNDNGAGKTIKAYKVSDLGNVSKDSTLPVTVAKSSGKVVAAFIALDAEPAGSTSNEVYGVITAVNGTTKIDNTAYTQYTVSVNGESSIVNVKSTGGALKKGQVVRYEPTSDNLYDAASDFALVATKTFSAYVKEYDADRRIITFCDNVQGKDPVTENGTDWTRYEAAGTSKTYAVKSDVKIYAVDKDAPTSSVGSDSSVTGFNTNTGKRNVYLVVNTDDEVEVIVVEISGQKDIDVVD